MKQQAVPVTTPRQRPPLQRILIGVVLIATCILTLAPLFHPGLFDVHDPTSLIRFFTLYETLKSGQFPAAWTNLLNHGYGYPMFLYYAPVFSYLGVIIKFFVPSYLLALKLALGLVVIVAGTGMYRFMRDIVGNGGALLSAVSYTFLPYHAATLYVRGSYAEGVTWALLPWVLSMWSRPVTTKRALAQAALTTAGFFLSHNSLPFAFLPLLILWIGVQQTSTKARASLALLLAGGLTAWFLLPVLFERGFVQVDRIATLTKYTDHFLTLQQLWHSPWGYGGSAPLGQVDGMSFMLGKFQLMIAGVSLMLLTLRKRWTKVAHYFTLLTLFYALMTTTISAPLWSLVPGLSIIQFPWRLLAFASFGVSVLCGYLLTTIPSRLRIGVVGILTLGLIFFNLKFFTPQAYQSYTDGDLLSQEKLDVTAQSKIPEYLPAWMPDFPTTTPADSLTRTATAVTGTRTLQNTEPLIIDVAYMPQWQLTLDGLHQGIKPSAEGKIQSDNDVHAGTHALVLTWHRTWIENVGLSISAASVIVVIGLLIWPNYSKVLSKKRSVASSR